MHRLIGDTAGSVLITFPLPFYFSADILVILYWLSVLSAKNIGDIGNTSRIYKPFIIVAAYLVIAELILSPIRNFYSLAAIRLISTVNVALALLLILITIAVVLVRIRKTRSQGTVMISD